MKRDGNIYLVGMMGAGKTTIGRLLARRLRRSFVDSDQRIEERTGVRIPTVFEIEGEQGFRRRESQVLEELAKEPDLVVATGGGIVLSEANRACLARSGLVIYLCLPSGVLWERTRQDRNRPLLQVADPRARMDELCAQRDPLYRSVADIVVEGGRSSPNAVVRHLEKAIQDRCAV